jgi:hypothetical protein
MRNLGNREGRSYVLTLQGDMYLMKTRLLLFAAILTMFIGTAFAADIDGRWRGTLDPGGMAAEQDFTFKVDAGKITGTMSNQFFGEVKITEGALKGEDISFTVSAKTEQMGDMTLKFSGKVTGADEMKLSMTFTGGPGGPDQGGGMGAMELVAKRLK